MAELKKGEKLALKKERKIPVLVCDLDDVLNVRVKNPQILVFELYRKKTGKDLSMDVLKIMQETSDLSTQYKKILKLFDGKQLDEVLDDMAENEIRLADGAKDLIDGFKQITLERMKEQKIVGVAPEEHIYIISAGPRRIAVEAAKRLGLKEENVFATEHHLNEETGEMELMSDVLSGPEKRKVLTQKILPRLRKHDLDMGNVIFIGDHARHDPEILSAVADSDGLAIPINYRPELINKLKGKMIFPMGSIHTKTGKIKNLKSILNVIEWFSSGGTRKIKFLSQDEKGEWGNSD